MMQMTLIMLLMVMVSHATNKYSASRGHNSSMIQMVYMDSINRIIHITRRTHCFRMKHMNHNMIRMVHMNQEIYIPSMIRMAYRLICIIWLIRIV